VRELENAVESLVALSHDGVIDLEGLDGPGDAAAPEPATAGLKARVDAYERGLIVAALEAARGNRSAAARSLDIGRATLHEKLRKYGLAGDDDA
jgi:two-component system response regulator HydG